MKKYIKEILFALVLILFVLASILRYSKLELTVLNIAVLVLIIVSIVFYVYALRKRVKELHSGNKLEDEMTQKVKIYAGYYSFLASFYLWVLIYLIINLNHININGQIDEVFGLGLFGSTIIYATVYYYLKATGNFYEK